MVASGVCHSCLHAADGSWQGIPLPIVLGDEGSGIVETVGPGVRHLRPGDHVVLSWAPTCGRCHYCVIGRPNLCENRQPGRACCPTAPPGCRSHGRPVYQYGHVATYASRHRGGGVERDPDPARHAARPGGPDRLLRDDGCRRGDQHGPGAAGRQHGGLRRGRHRPQRRPGRRAGHRASDRRRRRPSRAARARAGARGHAPDRRVARGPGGGHPGDHPARRGLHLRRRRRRARHGPGHRRPGARGHRRPDRRPGHRGDGAARASGRS